MCVVNIHERRMSERDRENEKYKKRKLYRRDKSKK